MAGQGEEETLERTGLDGNGIAVDRRLPVHASDHRCNRRSERTGHRMRNVGATDHLCGGREWSVSHCIEKREGKMLEVKRGRKKTHRRLLANHPPQILRTKYRIHTDLTLDVGELPVDLEGAVEVVVPVPLLRL
jgi:hypothetical protein